MAYIVYSLSLGANHALSTYKYTLFSLFGYNLHIDENTYALLCSISVLNEFVHLNLYKETVQRSPYKEVPRVAEVDCFLSRGSGTYQYREEP